MQARLAASFITHTILVLLSASLSLGAFGLPLNQRSGIPKMIHQSWKVEKLPTKLLKWQQTMRDMHPTWEYRLWTDEANRELVREHYPWLLETYDSFPENIMRADTARVLYLHKYGGLYADLDFEVLQPFDKLIDKETLVLAAMTDDSSFNHRIPNAWMASVPEHPFWQFCIRHIVAAATPCAWQPKKKWFGQEEKRKWDWVEEVTGPPMLLKAIVSYNATAPGPPKVLPPGIIYPIDWRLTSRDWKKSGSVLAKGAVPTKRPGQHEVCDPRQSGFSELACKAKFPNAYAITYWMHSW